MSKREIQSKLDHIIAFSGIEEFIDTPVKRYSSGMYARLGFSVAAHVDPEVLIVDEVLSVGDYVFQRKCVERMKEVIRGGATVLFVSHNLKSVAEFCHRCLLLEKGRTVMTGPAQEVIAAYLNRSPGLSNADANSDLVAISKVRIRNEGGECSQFQSGQKTWIDVELIARKRCGKLAVCLYITDEEYEEIFSTSTERLGHGSFTLDINEIFVCTFELTMNLAPGIYHASVLVYRYDIQTAYDRREPAATIHVSSDVDERGIVHCAPKVICHEIRRASSVDLAATARVAGGDKACSLD